MKTSAGFALICSALLTLPHVSPGASVRAPALYAANPFEVYSDTLPRLYTIENLSYRIYPSLSRGLFSWRPYIGGVPAGRIAAVRSREAEAFAARRPKTQAALRDGTAAFLGGVPMLWMR